MTARETARLYMVADALASNPSQIVQTISTIKAAGARSVGMEQALDTVAVLARGAQMAGDPGALAKAMTAKPGLVGQLGLAFEEALNTRRRASLRL